MSHVGNALDLLRGEREKLEKELAAVDRAIAALSENDTVKAKGTRKARVMATAKQPRRKRRSFSEETKAKMREAQRRRREQERGPQVAPAGE